MKDRIIFIIQVMMNISLLALCIVVCLVIYGDNPKSDFVVRTGVEVPKITGDTAKESLEDITVIYRYEKIGYEEDTILVPFLSIPQDRQKEERINRIMEERYMRVLPCIIECGWYKMMTPRITYRSERYLCFRYMPLTHVPEGCDYGELYFTLDIEKEKWIEYPTVYTWDNAQVGVGIGNLWIEKEENEEKSVEEQNDLLGETSYRVYEKMNEYKGYNFYEYPCAAIEGMADKRKQDRINEILQEPFRLLISNGGEWHYGSDMEKEILRDVKIYVAYKSEKWLSIVYSFKRSNKPDRGLSDGMAEIGITIDMESGEQVMLDDLFEITGLLDWMCTELVWDEESCTDEIILGSVLTERELLEWYQGKNGEEMNRYRILENFDSNTSFYLYKGKLVILRPFSSVDSEVPLPEVYEYLKVDPWYD